MPVVILYKPNERGRKYNESLDPRAGRFAISRTAVEDFMFDSPLRYEIPVKECPINAFEHLELTNAEDLSFAFETWGGRSCLQGSSDEFTIQGL